MARRKKPTFKQIKRAAAKKAGKTKHQLTHMKRCIATAKMFDSGLTAMEIAVEQRRRLDEVRKDLRDFFTKGDPLELKHLPPNFQVLEIARRRITEAFSQENINAAQKQIEGVINSVQQGIQQAFTRTPLGSTIPRTPAPSPSRRGMFRE